MRRAEAGRLGHQQQQQAGDKSAGDNNANKQRGGAVRGAASGSNSKFGAASELKGTLPPPKKSRDISECMLKPTSSVVAVSEVKVEA